MNALFLMIGALIILPTLGYFLFEPRTPRDHAMALPGAAANIEGAS